MVYRADLSSRRASILFCNSLISSWQNLSLIRVVCWSILLPRVLVWFRVANWPSYPWRSIAVRTSQQHDAICDAIWQLPAWIALIICCPLIPTWLPTDWIWLWTELIADCTALISQFNVVANWLIAFPFPLIACNSISLP